MKRQLGTLLSFFMLSVFFFPAHINRPSTQINRPSTQTVSESQPELFPVFALKKATGDLPEMRKRKWIRALVTSSKSDFFLVNGQPKGLQAEFFQHYEKLLNKGVSRNQLKTSLVFVPVPFDRLIPSLLEGKGDIAAAFLTITPEREKLVAFASDSRLKVDEIVVAGRSVKGLNSIEDLSGRTLYVLRGSSYVYHLKALNRRLRLAGKALVKIREADSNLLTEDIFEMVNAGVVELTVADDLKARLWANVLPNIVVREDLKIHAGGRVGWAVRKDNPLLLKSLEEFTQNVKKGTLLGNMVFNRYYLNTRWIRNPLEDIERKKYSRFVTLFKKYGKIYSFDYLAIAAQAFQESGLNHHKLSPKGAVGLMQILPSTATDPNVDIPGIDDVENNIHAGVKYLAFLRDRYFSYPAFSDEDRLAFTWAAYNAGPAKVRRMQQRARQMGLDPKKWFQNVEYAALKLAGQETVRYVANIYKYYIAYKLVEDMTFAKSSKFPLNPPFKNESIKAPLFINRGAWNIF